MSAPVEALIRPVVVLCPPLTKDTPTPTWYATVERRLAEVGAPTIRPAAGGPPPELPPGPDPGPAGRLALAGWVADQAVAITASGIDQPLILVASGPATTGLPALGFSQRASRRSVVAYVLVDGPLPLMGPATGDWPDAPVLCVQHTGTPELDVAVSAGARLRGWRVLREDPVSVLCRLVERWPDLP